MKRWRLLEKKRNKEFKEIRTVYWSEKSMFDFISYWMQSLLNKK